MNKFSRFPPLILLILFFSMEILEGQDIIQLKSKYNSLEKFWVTTFEGGITTSLTDFQSPGIGYSARAGIEYYLPSTSLLTFGFRFYGAYGELKGESNTGRLSGDGTLMRLIKKFNTPFVLLEPSLAIAIGKNQVIPYVSLGFDYVLAFIPLETNGYSLYTNSKRNPFLTFSGEFGIRYFVHKDFSLNIAAKYFKGNNDELDGFVSRKNDSFLMITTGISLHLFRKERIR